jgi:hypothetical protein
MLPFANCFKTAPTTTVEMRAIIEYLAADAIAVQMHEFVARRVSRP